MGNAKQNGRNGKIELMRFICAVIIVGLHFTLYNDVSGYFLSGALAVEFFFILSGYLMMASIDRAQNTLGASTDLGGETFRFISKKLKGLYPEVLIAYIIAFVVLFFAKGKTLTGAIKLAIDSIWEVFLLNETGLQTSTVNSVTWYLSAMIISMAILYPLLRKNSKLITNIILPLAALFVLGYLCKNYSTPRNPNKWIGFAFKGMLRGFAEIGMGVVCYQITKAFSRLNLTTFGKVILTSLEPVLYVSYIVYLLFIKSSTRDWILVPLLMLAIGISFSGHTFTHRLFDNAATTFLGKFSLPLYLGHFCWGRYFSVLFPNIESWQMKICIYCGVSLASAAAIYLLSSLIRRYGIAKKLLRLFVVAEHN